MSIAWHNAGLTRYPKRLPRLERLLVKSPTELRIAWQKNLMIAQRWAARGVGKIGKLH